MAVQQLIVDNYLRVFVVGVRIKVLLQRRHIKYLLCAYVVLVARRRREKQGQIGQVVVQSLVVVVLYGCHHWLAVRLPRTIYHKHLNWTDDNIIR